MSGAAFSLLADSLAPETSSTGHVERFESMVTNWDGMTGDIEINHFESDYRDVLFVSLRSLEPTEVDLNFTNLLGQRSIVTIDRLTIDPASSDGLSNYADPNGQNRIPRRVIDAEELAQLKTLAFFDPQNQDHVRYSGDQISTYLPPFETIIPLVANPESIEDYYFAAEVDVNPLIITMDPEASADGSISLGLMPFDVLRIVVDTPLTVEGGADDEILVGGLGRDIIFGGLGNDTLQGGEANDTLKGGFGDDSIDAGSGDDSVVAGPGEDVIIGGGGNDTLVSTGSDIVNGGSDDDTIILQADGFFTAGYSATNAARSDVIYDSWVVSVEGMSQYSSVIYGGAGSDFVILGDGNDAIFYEDVFSDMHNSLGDTLLPRLSGVEKVYAGLGDDLIDLELRACRRSPRLVQSPDEYPRSFLGHSRRCRFR